MNEPVGPVEHAVRALLTAWFQPSEMLPARLVE
jgi:hypothetical protein